MGVKDVCATNIIILTIYELVPVIQICNSWILVTAFKENGKGVFMSKKYESLAQAIIQHIGGKENVKSVYHCATRLRFALVEEQKADKEALMADPGVSTVIISSGSYQVVIGPHVADVFEEVEKLVDVTGATTSMAPAEKKKIFSSILDFISGIFMPVIPALSGAGMIKAVLAILVLFKVVATDSQTYYLLNNVFADGIFYFLPMMLAYTTAQKLKCNPILAIGVAAMMLHPNWLGMVNAKETVMFFEFIPFKLTGYASSVIPIILVILVQAKVEKFLHKVIPSSVELVIVPLVTFLAMGTLAFSILGPLGAILGGYLAEVFIFLSENAAWAPAALIGMFCPLMVMIGLHNAVAPLGVVQMSNLGFDSIWGPGNICSNMAQAAATTVVAFRTRDKQTRQIATSASVTAFMGITEPALYGVNLPKKYPLFAAMIGGGCGGLFAGLTHTHRFATGSGGLPAVTLYIGDNTMQYFYNIIIAMIISIVVSAVLTFILSIIYEKKETVSQQVATPIATSASQIVVPSPLQGEVVALQECSDEAFASGAMGKGVVVKPRVGEVYAPFDGVIATLFPSKHAIGIISNEGVEMLIHVGINTVELQGQYFHALVEQGAKVTAGDCLLTFDIEAIEAAGYLTETMIIITNSNAYSDCLVLANDVVQPKHPLLALEA